MKSVRKIIFSVLIILSLLCMFLPIATFQDNTLDSINADITKQQDKLKRQEDKVTRYIEQGKAEDTIAKEQAKVEKEQGKLDELLAQKAELENAETASGLKYSLLPNKLPAELQVDMQIVNQGGGIYATDFTLYHIL
ncbi:MAG: hypothetical protein IKM64_07260, partial [Clostridia bacterium]|nr:hypothetical protein [Clostridia bacterium]